MNKKKRSGKGRTSEAEEDEEGEDDSTEQDDNKDSDNGSEEKEESKDDKSSSIDVEDDNCSYVEIMHKSNEEDNNLDDVEEDEDDKPVRKHKRQKVGTDCKDNSNRALSKKHQEVMVHFLDSGEKTQPTKANSHGIYLCLCKYCCEAFDMYNESRDMFKSKYSDNMKPPKTIRKVVRKSRDLWNHLYSCTFYKLHLDVPEKGDGKPVGWAVKVKSLGQQKPESLGISCLKCNYSHRQYSFKYACLYALFLIKLNRYISPGLSEDQKVQFHRLCCEMVVDNDLQFRLIQQNAVFHIPGVTAFRKTYLEDMYKEEETRQRAIIKTMQKSGIYPGLTCDGWKAIDKTHTEGVILTLGNATVAIDSYDPDTVHHGIAIAQEMESLFNCDTVVRLGVKEIKYLCTDSSRKRQVVS